MQARQLQQNDPAQALAAAQRAHELATQSLQAAQSDVGVFQGGMFGGSGGSPRTGTGGDMMGAILGGIVINSLLNGGGGGRSRSGGGFGGLGGGGSISPGGSAAPAAARDAAEVASELGIRSPPPTARSPRTLGILPLGKEKRWQSSPSSVASRRS